PRLLPSRRGVWAPTPVALPTVSALFCFDPRAQPPHSFLFKDLRRARGLGGGDPPQSGPTGEAIAIDWSGIRPMRRNPRTSDHAPGTAIRRAQEQFNESHCALLRALHQVFNGSPLALRTAIGSLGRLKAPAP